MRYKNYIGEVEYHFYDEVFHGKIINCGPQDIYFSGKTVEELQIDMANAVEDYLQTCRDLHKEPHIPGAEDIKKEEGQEEE